MRPTWSPSVLQTFEGLPRPLPKQGGRTYSRRAAPPASADRDRWGVNLDGDIAALPEMLALSEDATPGYWSTMHTASRRYDADEGSRNLRGLFFLLGFLEDVGGWRPDVAQGSAKRRRGAGKGSEIPHSLDISTLERSNRPSGLTWMSGTLSLRTSPWAPHTSQIWPDRCSAAEMISSPRSGRSPYQ